MNLTLHPGQCCNELELNLDHLYLQWKAKGIEPPGGRFRKQIFFSNQKVVYHNAESDYYIYNTGNEWVVSEKYNIYFS